MRIFKKEKRYVVKWVMEGFTCDKCGKKVTYEEHDWVEIQEAFHYDFTGGYGSVFGDEVTFEIDLCQNCLKELLGAYFRVKKEGVQTDEE